MPSAFGSRPIPWPTDHQKSRSQNRSGALHSTGLRVAKQHLGSLTDPAIMTSVSRDEVKMVAEQVMTEKLQRACGEIENTINEKINEIIKMQTDQNVKPENDFNNLQHALAQLANKTRIRHLEDYIN